MWPNVRKSPQKGVGLDEFSMFSPSIILEDVMYLGMASMTSALLPDLH
jgi:hypothetical protein